MLLQSCTKPLIMFWFEYHLTEKFANPSQWPSHAWADLLILPMVGLLYMASKAIGSRSGMKSQTLLPAQHLNGIWQSAVNLKGIRRLGNLKRCPRWENDIRVYWSCITHKHNATYGIFHTIALWFSLVCSMLVVLWYFLGFWRFIYSYHSGLLYCHWGIITTVSMKLLWNVVALGYP